VVVAVAVLTLALPEDASLKDKRRVVKSVLSRVQARYRLAAAEVATQDQPHTATLALACVSTGADHAHAVLERAVRFVEESRVDAYLADYRIEMY
jgi:uncharacterized protein YlxP (DUF503 family)